MKTDTKVHTKDNLVISGMGIDHTNERLAAVRGGAIQLPDGKVLRIGDNQIVVVPIINISYGVIEIPEDLDDE